CVLLLGGANRDPDRFDDPERLHLARPDNRHLAFGGGAHYCLGAPLARIEGQIAIRRLVERARRIELAEEPAWRDSVTLRGVRELRLAIEPA
ncbi:MAG: cytochrome P450, partial [Actinomycetota bacterium]